MKRPKKAPKKAPKKNITQKQKIAQRDMPWGVGEAWFFRTVTHHHTGRIKEICGKFLVLEDAAWIADDGRFRDCIEYGTPAEVEPIEGEFILNTDSLVDATKWKHPLPREQR